MNCSKEKEEELRKKIHVKNVYAVDCISRFVIDDDNYMCDEFYHKNKHILDKLRNDFCDEESRIQFDEFINQKRTGIYRKSAYSRKPQYFDNDIIPFSQNEVFVDCGAYNGDTVLAFIENLKANNITGYNKIYAFEADKKNFAKLCANVKSLKNIEVIPMGVYDDAKTLFFGNEGTTAARISDRGTSIETTKIDEAVKNDNVTFIKMDIEGSELKALKGAENIIKRCRPKLAICVYHKSEDLITIPQYIQSLNPNYKLYFRNYEEQAVESVIYAV